LSNWNRLWALDYEKATEYIVNHVKKVFHYGDDIGTALELLQPIDTTPWKPQMHVSVTKDKILQAAKN
jgi:hypothetical protein